MFLLRHVGRFHRHVKDIFRHSHSPVVCLAEYPPLFHWETEKSATEVHCISPNLFLRLVAQSLKPLRSIASKTFADTESPSLPCRQFLSFSHHQPPSSPNPIPLTGDGFCKTVYEKSRQFSSFIRISFLLSILFDFLVWPRFISPFCRKLHDVGWSCFGKWGSKHPMMMTQRFWRLRTLHLLGCRFSSVFSIGSTCVQCRAGHSLFIYLQMMSKVE